MKQYFTIIKKNPLFAGIGPNELEDMLDCVQGRVQEYEKGALIQLAGNAVETVGLVLFGEVHVVREDSEGRQILMTKLHTGELFGEVFACAGIAHSPVTVLASEKSEVLHINYRKVITTCSAGCVFHLRLIENMLTILAQKSLILSQKLELLSKRTTRERLLLFFDQYRRGANVFTLPYNREELAAYLCVERSAMSAELSRMQRDGLIACKGRQIELKR